jgi:hypothetical protein
MIRLSERIRGRASTAVEPSVLVESCRQIGLDTQLLAAHHLFKGRQAGERRWMSQTGYDS